MASRSARRAVRPIAATNHPAVNHLLRLDLKRSMSCPPAPGRQSADGEPAASRYPCTTVARGSAASAAATDRRSLWRRGRDEVG